MLSNCLAALLALAFTGCAAAEQVSIEKAAEAAGVPIATGSAAANGLEIYYRDIGQGTPILLLHGFPETGDAFAAVVGDLGKRYRLIVPDLRGTGRSQVAPSGYEKRIIASDAVALLDHLGIRRAHVVGHDIGARVAYALAVQHPERVASLTVAEAFIEGLAGTADFKRFAPTNARTAHFQRFARVEEALVEFRGREEALVLSFMNSRSKERKFVSADVGRYVSSLRREGGLRAAFLNYEAFDRDAAFLERADMSALVQVPALAMVCRSPAGNGLQRQLFAAGLRSVRAVTLEGCAHWIWEENPAETLAALTDFLGGIHVAP